MRNARISLAGFAFVFLTLAFLTEAATHYGSTLATTEFPYRKKGCSGTDSVAYFGVLGSAIHCCTCSFSRCYGRSSLHEACVEELISTVKRASNDPSKFPLGALIPLIMLPPIIIAVVSIVIVCCCCMKKQQEVTATVIVAQPEPVVHEEQAIIPPQSGFNQPAQSVEMQPYYNAYGGPTVQLQTPTPGYP